MSRLLDSLCLAVALAAIALLALAAVTRAWVSRALDRRERAACR